VNDDCDGTTVLKPFVEICGFGLHIFSLSSMVAAVVVPLC